MHPPGSNPLYVSVHITTSSLEEGETIGATLVKERLAACVNIIGNVESVYLWEGRLEKSTEALMLAKTREDLVEKLIERVQELHSYEVPAVLVLPIIHGNEDYFKWMETELGKP